jgi:RNA 3'-terminal phosphate cyclase (ATP)
MWWLLLSSGAQAALYNAQPAVSCFETCAAGGVMSSSRGDREIELDGSRGEGGGQILRTALTLSLLTGRPFRMKKIRANRSKPGLRPQHLKAVEAAGSVGRAEVIGARVGGRELAFAPGESVCGDLTIDIGTAGSTGLVLQTLQLPLAMRAEYPVTLVLTGGTFNPMAPAFSFLETTWRGYLRVFGMTLDLAMPAAGFYPKGGGKLKAVIAPGVPVSYVQVTRGPLLKLHGAAGVSNLSDSIAERMRKRAIDRLDSAGLSCEIELVRWPGPGQGAAISLILEHEGTVPATFVGLGERGRPSEAVADEAVDQLLAFESVADAAVDLHSADQILLPLAFAAGRSEFSVSHVTEHLRTNVETIGAFLERKITVHEAGDEEGRAARVVIE